MPLFTLCRYARAVTCAVVLVVAGAHLHADSRSEVVRVLNPALAEALDVLYRVSPRARDIVDELERSDLIIHVQGVGLDLRPRFLGTTRFVRSAGGRRFLRLTVNERLPIDRRAAAFAHELQHAVEVARASSVTDLAGFRALYKQIGYHSGDDPHAECYETPEALRVGARALADFKAAAANARHAQRSALNGSD